MNWYHYLLGWIVTNLWIALTIGILTAGLWVQGWLAGRKYYNRARPDPWGSIGGRLIVEMIRAKKGEDREVEIFPGTTWWQELPNGERIENLEIGRRSDGQSIPPPGWPLVGSPLTGRSREVNTGGHDEECKRRRWPPEKVHGASYCGMRARGMYLRGPIMHAILLNWGSRWKLSA